MCRKPKSVDIDDDVIPIPESVYIAEIHRYVNNAPIPKLLKTTERKIIKFVPEKCRKKYPEIVREYMNEVHLDFDKVIKAYSSQKILKPLKGDFIPERLKFSFKYLGKTTKYRNFLSNRRKIKEHLFIPYPFIRAILGLSEKRFPAVLNDYGRYSKNKDGEDVWMTLAEFESTAQKDLENSSIFLREEWYPKVVKIILKYYKKRVIPPHLWQKAFNCAKGLINRQLTELKIRTFEHIFEVLQDRTKTPYFKFQTVCTNFDIELYPSLIDVLNTFHNIFKSISLVGHKLPALEQQIDRGSFSVLEPYLKIQISEIFMNEVLVKLENSIKITYKPILEYLNEFQRKFHCLYSAETRQELTSFLSEPKQYEVYLKKIEFFQDYVIVLQKMVQNEFFNVAMVNQSKAIMGLRTVAQEYMGEISANIVAAHRKECTDICEWFEAIQKRAFEVPKMTETLLSNGEFILHVKTKQMFEIQERIQGSLKVRRVSRFYFYFQKFFNVFFTKIKKM